MRTNKKSYFARTAFTLVELLTSISIISILMLISLPAINSVRQSAYSIKCMSNIRSTGVALLSYCISCDDYYPPAYTYSGSKSLENQLEEPVCGISHWSGLLLNEKYVSDEILQCPTIPRGGLPPANTTLSNLESGQVCTVDSIIDNQAARCAFTVNEALCPRNRFIENFEGALKVSRLVKSAEVKGPHNTVLMTEWIDDWKIVTNLVDNVSMSYMPVHGFKGMGKMWPDRYDLNMVKEEAIPCLAEGPYKRVAYYDLSATPNTNRRYPSRLDWVGRNHGNNGKANFYYVDGHIESKTVYESIDETDFEWGQIVYSIKGNNKVNEL